MLIIIVLMFILSYKYQFLIGSHTDKEICKRSIFLASIGKDFRTTVPEINCKPSVIDVEGKEEQAVIKGITDATYDCYDMVFEGQKDAYQTGERSGLSKYFKGDNEKFCIPCSVLRFKDKSMSLNSQDIIEYQTAAVIPKDRLLPLDDQRTYAEYFTDYHTDPTIIKDKVRAELAGKQISLETKNDYVVMYVVMRKGYISHWITALWGGGTGAAVGLGAGVGGAAALGTGIIASSALIVAAPLALAAGGAYVGYTLLGEDMSADWDAGVVVIPYQPEILKQLGCTYVPGSWDSTQVEQ